MGVPGEGEVWLRMRFKDLKIGEDVTRGPVSSKEEEAIR